MKPPDEARRARALGYTSFAGPQEAKQADTQRIAAEIEAACDSRGLVLEKLVGDVESGPDLKRPGLIHVLEVFKEGGARVLVVATLARLSSSPAVVATLLGWLRKRDVRLIVIDIDLDTDTAQGRLAAQALMTVGDLERTKLEERTRKELEAPRSGRRASGRPAVADRPALQQRIAEMRQSGMTLQAIADALNRDEVPTLRGGAEWRPSSVQAAAGYKRPKRKAKPGAAGEGHRRQP